MQERVRRSLFYALVLWVVCTDRQSATAVTWQPVQRGVVYGRTSACVSLGQEKGGHCSRVPRGNALVLFYTSLAPRIIGTCLLVWCSTHAQYTYTHISTHPPPLNYLFTLLCPPRRYTWPPPLPSSSGSLCLTSGRVRSTTTTTCSVSYMVYLPNAYGNRVFSESFYGYYSTILVWIVLCPSL